MPGPVRRQSSLRWARWTTADSTMTLSFGLLVVGASELLERVVQETAVGHRLDIGLGRDVAVLGVPVLLVAQAIERDLAVGIHVAPLHLVVHRLVLEAGVLDADVDHLGALGSALHGVEVVAHA